MKIEEVIKGGGLYCNDDPSFAKEQLAYHDLIHQSNTLPPSHWKEREAIFAKLFAALGKDCFVVPPFHAAWGKNIHFGSGVFANFNLTLLDDSDIFIGDDVMFAPNVTVTTAAHPIDPTLRRKKMEYNFPITIKNNVWVGASVVILPGVTIGENSVIGAGSVVTKDIPDNVVAAGNPCRILREISDYDRKYYAKKHLIDEKFFEE